MPRTFDPRASASEDPFAPPPVGQYIVRVKADSVEIRQSKSSGESYLNLQLIVLAGPLDACGITQKSPYAERIIFEMLSYSEKVKARLGQAFIAVGHADPPRDLDDEDEMRDEVFGGRVVMVALKHEEWQGQARARVVRWNPATMAMLAAWPHRPPHSAFPTPPGSEVSAVGVDDDMPF